MKRKLKIFGIVIENDGAVSVNKTDVETGGDSYTDVYYPSAMRLDNLRQCFPHPMGIDSIVDDDGNEYMIFKRDDGVELHEYV